jgi:hypothetical protein
MEPGNEVAVQEASTFRIAGDHRKRLVRFTHLVEYDAGTSEIMITGVIIDGDDGLQAGACC